MQRFRMAAGLLFTSALLFSACERADEMATKNVVAPEPVDAETHADTHSDDEHANHQAGADEAHDADGERLESHVHGAATLAITLDGDTLTATLEAPLMSMVGFEREPETDDERQSLNAVVDAFTAPMSMIEINRSAGCLPQQTSSGTHMSHGHGELAVEHIYICDKPEQIGRIDFLLMAGYPDLMTIDAVFLSDTKQVAKTLTQSDHALELN